MLAGSVTKLPPLHRAVRAGDVEGVKDLLEEAAVDPDERDTRGRCALHWAAQMHQGQDLVAYLIGQGLDVDARDKRGRTPLHYAMESGRRKNAQHLLGMGADPCAEFDGGMVALQLCARDGRRDLVIDLLKAGASTEVRGSPYRSALQLAVSLGHIQIVGDLLKAGADMNAEYPQLDQEYGKSPLMVAAFRGYREMVEQLLHAGADIDKRDVYDKKAYDYAQEAAYQGNPRAEEVKQVLLSYSSSRVVAGGDRIETLTAQMLLMGSVIGGYANLITDVFVAAVLYVNRDFFHFALVLVCILLPPCIFIIQQVITGFYLSAARSALYVELLYSAFMSLKTETKSSNFMTLKFIEMSFQSIPSAVLQLNSLLGRWNEWEIGNGNPAVTILMSSITISLVTSLHTVTFMAMENGDSVWRPMLQDSPALVKLVAFGYFLGDGILHVLVFATMAYTHYGNVWIVFAVMVLLNWALLTMGFMRPQSSNLMLEARLQILLRALILAPLLTVIDFPLKPNESGGKGLHWISYRSFAMSTAILFVCTLLSVFAPERSLKDQDARLPTNFLVSVVCAFLGKCLCFGYIVRITNNWTPSQGGKATVKNPLGGTELVSIKTGNGSLAMTAGGGGGELERRRSSIQHVQNPLIDRTAA